MLDDTIYDLTEEEYQKCLATAEIAVFSKGESVANPKSIFAVAQPGAGKTALRAYLINEAQRTGKFIKFIEFNPDEIAIHHKHYREIIQNCPDISYNIIKRFTFPALDTYLRPRAVDIRCNIMQEGTFATTDGYLAILEFQKNGGNVPIGPLGPDGKRKMKHVQGGYNIDINALAVNRFESLLSCFEREQYFIENDLPPRAVTRENHDRAYSKMLDTIDIVERKNLFSTMRVFRRGYIEEKPELIYITGDKRFPSTSEAIRYERGQQEQELFRNPQLYLSRIKDLHDRLEAFPNNSLSKRLDDLESIFLTELQAHKGTKII